MDHLPVWLALTGRSVLVVGGRSAATAKLRLAHDAGAAVTVVAPTLSDEGMRLAGVTHVAREFAAGDVAGRRLVFGATGIDAVDRAVSAAARAAGVPVNIVDRPELSDFLMPAIVDRGPVVVGIATGGTVPALAAHVRGLIEAALPQGLDRLASFAASFRSAVKATVAAGPVRLRFWNRVLNGPVAEAALAGNDVRARELMLQALNRAEGGREGEGSVTLVGAGPGNADLLTLRAVRAIRAADVLVYDRLIGPEVLDYARRDAERVFVGKQTARHALPQEEINALLAARARAGQRVVRLKGGDPFVFGRGGEEVEYLQRAGVAVEVVPGVTAALGCAAAAGIPLTHREVAMSVTFVTGHASEGAVEPDWADLARANHTLVVYMGVANAGRIAAELIRHGLAATTPVAVIENGTLPGQRVVGGTLVGLEEQVERHQIASPALLIIGEVARGAVVAAADARQAAAG